MTVSSRHGAASELATLIKEAGSVVALTGAGISVPSGIPDFRTPAKGLWEKVDPMEVAHIDAFHRDARRFWRFYRPRFAELDEKHPNGAHDALAALEAGGMLEAVVTQNIDRLHTKAGSERVIEVHGSIATSSCTTCRASYPLERVGELFDIDGVATCACCLGKVKPDVVLFGELLPEAAMAEAQALCAGADLLLCVVNLDPHHAQETTIRLDLGASVEQLEWTVNAYNLSFAVLLITGAALGDRLGRRRMYAAGLVLFALASAACALAPSVGALIAARTIQGAGAALVLPLALALLSGAFPPDKRGAAIGMFSAITGIAVALGPLVGGAVVEGIDWEWIFWINVPIGLLAAPLVLRRLSESRGADSGLDLPGLGLVSAGAFGIVWALVRANAAGWASLEVLGALAGGLALVASFVAWERRAREPMLPIRFFRSRAFAAGNGAIFFTIAPLFACVFLFAQFLQTTLGYGALETGLRLMPWTITFILVAPAAGALADRIGERPLMTAGLAIQAAGLLWLALIADAGVAYSQLLGPFVVAGIGVSMAIPSAQNAVVRGISL
ncbi:MAG: MFS transporter, partial [Solirubrobacterales bacterium]|nr:MFS transporter [Solirubrobacterales bacterium]